MYTDERAFSSHRSGDTPRLSPMSRLYPLWILSFHGSLGRSIARICAFRAWIGDIRPTVWRSRLGICIVRSPSGLPFLPRRVPETHWSDRARGLRPPDHEARVSGHGPITPTEEAKGQDHSLQAPSPCGRRRSLRGERRPSGERHNSRSETRRPRGGSQRSKGEPPRNQGESLSPDHKGRKSPEIEKSPRLSPAHPYT